MTHTVQGISPMWLSCTWVFCLINLALVYRGWHEKAEHKTFLLFIVYLAWSIGLIPLFILLALKASHIVWGWYDTATAVGVVTSVAITILVGKRFHRSIGDPEVRGVLGAIFRGIPHVALAYKFWLLGAGGLAAMTVWVAHLTTWVRILHLASIIRTSGWGPAQRGNAIAEGVNELTWILVTIVWWRVG